ncbi:MAG: homocysteine S-methyltransferase family protein [Candidatus Heimdallarchaeota archaeon]|nr:homocysteine S-methyltransferase family protein [Candidatus Heimdallarchaeota archaeon]
MSLIELIGKKKLLFDGAMGSMLIARGMTTEDVPELWNIKRSTEVQEIHQNYAKAGADLILTNTFGASPLKLGEKGVENVSEIISKAVENARSASRFVIGDIGPTGKFLSPMGTITEQELFDTFYTQAKLLIQSGVDGILIETMYDLREAIAAVQAVRAIDTNIPVMATMTFDRKKRGFFTIMGNTPEQCFSQLADEGASVVGANCTLSSEDMVELARISRDLTDLPLIFQANAGQPEIRGGEVMYPESPEVFANNMIEILEVADIIGGCCGTDYRHINKIKELMG